MSNNRRGKSICAYISLLALTINDIEKKKKVESVITEIIRSNVVFIMANVHYGN